MNTFYKFILTKLLNQRSHDQLFEGMYVKGMHKNVPQQMHIVYVVQRQARIKNNENGMRLYWRSYWQIYLA